MWLNRGVWQAGTGLPLVLHERNFTTKHSLDWVQNNRGFNGDLGHVVLFFLFFFWFVLVIFKVKLI